jgi:hypothetical protein
MLAIEHRRGMRRDQACDRILAGAPPSNDPKFAHSLPRWLRLVNGAKELDLRSRHRQSKCALQKSPPAVPALAPKPGLKQSRIVQRVDDVDSGAIHAASPFDVPAIFSCVIFSAAFWAM